jgi:hypothetical protein
MRAHGRKPLSKEFAVPRPERQRLSPAAGREVHRLLAQWALKHLRRASELAERTWRK